MKKILYFLIILITIFLWSCSKGEWLDLNPKGKITSEEFKTPEGVEKLCIAAYAATGNDANNSPISRWIFNFATGDAHKGGNTPSDMMDWHHMEVMKTLVPNNTAVYREWRFRMTNINRANTALKYLNEIPDDKLSTKAQRIAEMRFLRAFNYFEFKCMFKYVPWLDETLEREAYQNISNREFTSDQLWDKIAAEFRYCAGILPDKQTTDPGRPDKWAAKAFLAKTLLFQAYQQNDNHQVTSINSAKLTEVNSLCDEIIASSGHSLQPDYANNFLYAYENGIESLWEIQFSVDDGTGVGRLDFGTSVNWPMDSRYGCCGFHNPTQNFVNAFKTDNNGLPMFDTYDQVALVTTQDFYNNNIDPRFNHTIVVPGHPLKYKNDLISTKAWARAIESYGPNYSVKELEDYRCVCFKKFPPFMSTSKNWSLIRFSEILLWKAEALIELNRQAEALPLINQIRTRSANSTGRLKWDNGTPYCTYKCGTYIDGVNCTWTKDFARKALVWENRLETGLEGHRFFDLVRWGIAADYINKYYESEKKRKAVLADAFFTLGKNEYFPIPQDEINYSNGLYVQNPGY